MAAMYFYAVGIKPLVDHLEESCCKEEGCKQSWYADDSSSIGWLLKLRKWWDPLTAYGPKFGYFPKPEKKVLLVKINWTLRGLNNTVV